MYGILLPMVIEKIPTTLGWLAAISVASVFVWFPVAARAQIAAPPLITVDFETGDASQVDNVLLPSNIAGCCVAGGPCSSWSTCDSTKPYCFSKGLNYAVLQSEVRDGYTILPRQGKYFGKITQREGEYTAHSPEGASNKCDGDSHFEFGMQGHPAPLSGHAWYGLSIYVPSSFEGNVGRVRELNALQFHVTGGGGSSPIYAIKIGNVGDEQWHLASKLERHGSKLIASTPLKRNTWTDWVIHVNWTTGQTGVFEIWKNGTLVFGEYNVNTQDGSPRAGPNIRWGSYSKEAWSATDYENNIYSDEFHAAYGEGGSYCLVAPRPDQDPNCDGTTSPPAPTSTPTPVEPLAEADDAQTWFEKLWDWIGDFFRKLFGRD